MAASRGGSARRFAQAAFDIAVESNMLDEWSRDLWTIAEFVREPEVATVLASGRLPRSEKQRLLIAALNGRVSPLAMNLARLLEARDKLDLAPRIATAFDEMANDRRGVANATVTTAVPLTDEERRAVTEKLSQITGKQVTVTPVVDESIIAGVVARIGDQLIDGSTRTRLIALRRRLAEVR